MIFYKIIYISIIICGNSMVVSLLDPLYHIDQQRNHGGDYMIAVICQWSYHIHFLSLHSLNKN
jgi:hypothetical protein